jgi:small subunit ribosomal protein S15
MTAVLDTLPYYKEAFHMSLTTQEKTQILLDYQRSTNDTGSPEVQIALLTHSINKLTEHFKTHLKDHHSRRGLLRKVSLRRTLLDYLKDVDQTRYRDLIARLKIRY